MKRRVGEGLILLFGNNDAPNNYPSNTYRFRQDSCFLYYFGQKREGLVGVIDIDNDREYLFGDDIDIDDIIWYGYVPSVKELAAEVGVTHTAPMQALKAMIDAVQAKGQTIHFIPQCRHDLMIQLADLMGFHPLQSKEKASVKLIKAIVDIRAVKKPEEIKELKAAAEIGYIMHTTAMKLCAPTVTEKYGDGRDRKPVSVSGEGGRAAVRKALATELVFSGKGRVPSYGIDIDQVTDAETDEEAATYPGEDYRSSLPARECISLPDIVPGPDGIGLEVPKDPRGFPYGILLSLGAPGNLFMRDPWGYLDLLGDGGPVTGDAGDTLAVARLDGDRVRLEVIGKSGGNRRYLVFPVAE